MQSKVGSSFSPELTPRLEGKWKLNQNRPPEQRRRVVEALTRTGDENSRELAELMRREIVANG